MSSKPIIYIPTDAEAVIADEDLLEAKLREIFELRREEALALLTYLEQQNNKQDDDYLYNLFKKSLPQYACNPDRTAMKFKLATDLRIHWGEL